MRSLIANREQGFLRQFLRAMLAAAPAFGAVHGVVELVGSMYREGVAMPRADGLLVLAVFELIQSIVFCAVGLFAAFVPAWLADRHLAGRARTPAVFAALGAAGGVLWLPLCAATLDWVLPSVDAPTFFDRCAESLLPMMLAGIIGGLVFGRLRSAANSARAASFD